MTGILNTESEPQLAPIATTERRHPHILLAEDDRQMRSLLAETLVREGYHVILCKNGWELLSQLRSIILGGQGHGDIDAVVSDIRMPGVTGLEVLESGTDNRVFPPMILITAFGDAGTHTMALEYGAAAILDKPFGIDELLRELKTIAPLR